MIMQRPPMFLDVRDLRLVDAVCRHGTLTKAGFELNMTQSAVSHALSDLERRVGGRLFERLGKRMAITPAGERLRAGALEVLSILRRTEDDLAAAAITYDTVMRVSTECYTSYHWLPHILGPFQAQYPRVATRIVLQATREPVRALLRGRIDVAIVGDAPSDRRLVSTPLFSDELVAVVSPVHEWAGRQHVEAQDFATQHLIRYAVPERTSRLFTHLLGPAGVVPRQVSQFVLTEAIIDLVKANLGVAVLATWVAAPHIDAGTLVAVRLGAEGIRRNWAAVYRRRPSVPAHLVAFTSMLKRGALPTSTRNRASQEDSARSAF